MPKILYNSLSPHKKCLNLNYKIKAPIHDNLVILSLNIVLFSPKIINFAVKFTRVSIVATLKVQLHWSDEDATASKETQRD